MAFPADGSTSKLILGGKEETTIGSINFVAQGTDDPAKFCIV